MYMTKYLWITSKKVAHFALIYIPLEHCGISFHLENIFISTWIQVKKLMLMSGIDWIFFTPTNSVLSTEILI